MNQYSQSHVNKLMAKQMGERTYESQTPCKNCGTIIKSVSHSGCVKCHTDRNKHKLSDGTMDKYKTPAVRNARTYRYRARKRNQMPPDANNFLILEFYEEAQRRTKETGIVHHVDHKTPLSQGGLHHQNNLQVITALENWTKGDR